MHFHRSCTPGLRGKLGRSPDNSHGHKVGLDDGRQTKRMVFSSAGLPCVNTRPNAVVVVVGQCPFKFRACCHGSICIHILCVDGDQQLSKFYLNSGLLLWVNTRPRAVTAAAGQCPSTLHVCCRGSIFNPIVDVCSEVVQYPSKFSICEGGPRRINSILVYNQIDIG